MKGILIEKDEYGYRSALQEIDEALLPEGDVTVRVEYSTISYKDGLAITGAGPVVRKFPMIPGVDFSGTVERSDDPRYKAGDQVVLTGWGVGEVHWGGLAEKARVPGDWSIPLPMAFTSRQAMAIGTAGFTAMLWVLALEKHGVTPQGGDLLVTGAAGGVGSVAVALLAELGYPVVAVSGRPENAAYLRDLGASDILDRSAFSESGKPLQKERWAGAIDVVGSHTLANICAQTRYGGIVATCGLAGGSDFVSTVMPFVLRGITLAGVESVMCPREQRLHSWERLAHDLNLAKLDAMTHEVPLGDALEAGRQVIAGKIRGRLVVSVGRVER